MYNYKLIDRICTNECNKSVIIKYNSGRTLHINNTPLYFYIKNKNIGGKVCKWDIELINLYLNELKAYNRNKNILTFRKMIKILECSKNGYYDFKDIIFEGKKGTAYILSQPLKTELKKGLEKNFLNIKFLYLKNEYSSEFLKDCLFIY